MRLDGRGECGNLIHSETTVDVTHAGFLSVMTVNIRFSSAVTTGVTQSEMFCISSVKHLGQLMAALGEGGISAKL